MINLFVRSVLFRTVMQSVTIAGRWTPCRSRFLRMISSIFYPDCGDFRVLGKQMLGVRSGLIGYLPEERAVPQDSP
jgi:ABC-type uncharacterized transport system ATPase subunit